MMARVHVTIEHEFDHPADEVFRALVDWPAHADWVPLTRVRLESGTGDVGTTFVATTGIGPLALPDRMRVDALDRDRRHAAITKIGPVLTGTVHIDVRPRGDGQCTVIWMEDITVPWLPRVAVPPVAAATRRGFASSLSRLARQLKRRPVQSAP